MKTAKQSSVTKCLKLLRMSDSPVSIARRLNHAIKNLADGDSFVCEARQFCRLDFLLPGNGLTLSEKVCDFVHREFGLPVDDGEFIRVKKDSGKAVISKFSSLKIPDCVPDLSLIAEDVPDKSKQLPGSLPPSIHVRLISSVEFWKKGLR